MNLCETCRFMAAERDERWDDDTDTMVPVERHTCVRIIHGNKDFDHYATPSAEQKAFVVDGSGYAARLVVLPTFGCVLHEEHGEVSPGPLVSSRMEG